MLDEDHVDADGGGGDDDGRVADLEAENQSAAERFPAQGSGRELVLLARGY